MRHHLGRVVRTRLPKEGFWARVNYEVNRQIIDTLYGNGHFESGNNRIRSLDPQTRVELVDDIQPNGGRNIDFICESDCPYISDCSSGKSPASAMRERAWYAYPLSRILATGNGQISKEFKPFFPSGEYTLSDLVEKARTYFNR